MPPREPDKHIFHTGGAMPKKTTSALFKKVSNALPKKSAALNAKAATKKAATKEASVENVLIQEGAITVPTESRKSTLLIAANTRAAAIKQKGKQRQVAINRTRKAAALAAKKAANLAVVVRRSTITQQQQQTTSDDRTRRTQLLITAIKAKGKKRSIQKLTEARAKLKSKISVDKTDASFALTSRLDRINNSRLNTLIPSKRAEIGDIEVVAAANHGTGLNSLKKSNDIITDADTKRTNAGNDTLAQISRNAQLDIDITNQHLPDRVKDLQDAGTTLSNDNAICANAAKNADTALILSSIKSTTEIPARIAYLNAATDNLVIPIKLKAAKELSDAAASRGIADIHDINRQITMDSANSRIKDQGVVDTQRKSAGADVATHTKELSDANLKKAANDENLTTIQKTHQNTIAGMEANADTSVGTFKKNLDDISAAASDQGGTVSKATKVRSDKEGEQVKNTSDIDSKKQEIQKALDNESTARADHDTSQKLIDDTSKNLDQQVQTTIPIKSDRDAADVDTKSHYPTHNPVDQKMVDRKDAIQNTEIPAQQKALDAAKKDLDIATTDIKDPKAHRAVNDVELATMPAQHSTLVANDVSLHSRSDAATTALNDAAAHRSDVAANIKSRQTVGQAHRVHSDDIQNVIDTHFQERSTGVSMVSDKDLNASVLSKRFDSSSSELTAATAHIAALPPFVASKKHMSDLGNLLETESTEITRLNGIRYELGATIPKENINLAMLDASRGSVPSRIAHTKAEAEIATTKANEVLPTLQDIDQNLEWANMGLDYYSSPPIKPVRDKIEKNTNLAGDAGKVVADINPLRIDAFNTAAKCHSDQLNADTGRSSSAHDADTFTGLQDTAGNNKIRNETALNGIEAKHRSDMEQMHSDTDGMVSSTKRHLDDASAAGLDQAGKASNATTVRSNKENEATTQGAETSKMLKEVGDASVNEGLAKMDHDTRLADISKTQSSLDTLVASEPTIKADRLQASSIAEASRPVHDPADITLKNRKGQINEIELPAAVNTHDTAVGKHDSVVSDLNSSSGPIAMKRAHIEELDNLTTKNSGLTNNDGALHAKLNMESNTIDSLKNRREAINETIISGNEVINTRAQDMDKVQNLIDAKNLEIRLAEPPLQMLHNIDIEKATATFEMDSGSRQHAISEGGLNTSKANIKGENGLLNTLGDDTTKLKKTQDDLNASITAETGNAHTHQIEIDTALQHKKDIQKNADNASSSADNALTNQHNTIDEIAGMQHTKDDIGLGILSEKDKIKKETGIAEASAVIAVDANIGRNTSNTTVKKSKEELDNTVAEINGEAVNAEANADAADRARRNKLAADADLDAIKQTHKDMISVMETDANGAVVKHAKELDDANGSTGPQNDTVIGSRKKRKEAEDDSVQNESDIVSKNGEVSKAHDRELSAKNQHDADLTNVGAHRKDLDDLFTDEPVRKKDRDDAEADADNNIPEHDPNAQKLKKRQDEIDGEIADLNPIKDKAEIEKQRAIDDLKSKKAEKSALPPQDDTTGLKADHDRIQKELDDEIKRKKELNDQEKVVKTHKEQSADVILAKQLLAGTISAQILAIINASIGPALFPIPTPPTIIQAFTYPLPSTASGATTSGPVESGPTIIAALTSGAGDNPSVITQLTIPTSVGIDLSSGPSGPIILSDYQRGYNNGTIAGNRDGTTDATADANNAFSNKESETLLKIKAQIGLLETAKQTNIDTAVAAAAQDAYCNEVQTQGTKGGIDIFKAFSECSAYFNRVKIFPSGPTIVQPPVYTEGSLSVSGAAESGAAKESGASELLSGGGYQEDLSGVMQFSGALTSGPATPSEEYDSGYVDGYRAAYKGIYITIFSLTLAINITKNPPKTIPLGYNESGAAETEESGAAETEESGAAEEKSSGPKIVTEADSVKPKISSVPITQQGGFLKLAKRHHKRGRTLMQHARLLDKIVGKTTAGRNS